LTGWGADGPLPACVGLAFPCQPRRAVPYSTAPDPISYRP
jgi:hypothetical protein